MNISQEAFCYNQPPDIPALLSSGLWKIVPREPEGSAPHSPYSDGFGNIWWSDIVIDDNGVESQECRLGFIIQEGHPYGDPNNSYVLVPFPPSGEQIESLFKAA